MTVDEQASANARLRDEAARFVEQGTLGRSDVMARLFDFLLERSLSGDIPKELEVAREVFGRDAEFDAMQDASVRVYIYRLRKKLDEFYAANPAADGRLAIPRGEYRLILAPANGTLATDIDPEEETLVAAAPRARRPVWIAAVVGALLLLLAAGGLILLVRRDADPALAALDLPPWSTLKSNGRPTFVVLGDYYIFGETGKNGQLSRLVREFSVNSREDLDEYLMFNPQLMGRYVDLDLNYLPAGAAPALHSVEPLIHAADRSGDAPLRMVTSSALNPTAIRGANIIYIGYLSGFGILAGPALGASQFAVGASYDELIDRRTGRHYESDWSRVMDAKTPTRDYGYVASIPGPSGTRLLIIAGTRDAGLMQAAEIAANPDELRRIAAAAKGAQAFEALYEVQALGNANLGSRLVAAYPLKPGDIWRRTGEAQDDLPDSAPAVTSPADALP